MGRNACARNRDHARARSRSESLNDERAVLEEKWRRGGPRPFVIAGNDRSRFQSERQQHEQFGGWLRKDREFQRFDPLQLIGTVRARATGGVVIVRIGVRIACQQRLWMVRDAELAQAEARRQEQWQACCHDQNSHQGQQRIAPESSVEPQFFLPHSRGSVNPPRSPRHALALSSTHGPLGLKQLFPVTKLESPENKHFPRPSTGRAGHAQFRLGRKSDGVRHLGRHPA